MHSHVKEHEFVADPPNMQTLFPIMAAADPYSTIPNIHNIFITPTAFPALYLTQILPCLFAFVVSVAVKFEKRKKEKERNEKRKK